MSWVCRLCGVGLASTQLHQGLCDECERKREWALLNQPRSFTATARGTVTYTTTKD